MTVYDYQSLLLVAISKTLNALDGVKPLVDTLYSLNFEVEEDEDEECGDDRAEAASLLYKIVDLCEESGEYFKSSQQYCDAIVSILGNVLYLDIFSSLINTNLFFKNAVQLGLPTKMALDLANIPGDSYLLRQVITDQPQLKGTAALEDPKTALRHLSRIWTTIALGDQGELSAWKTLLDSGIPLENITIKPKLINQLGKRAEPDFYCEAEQLICDAKAWKDIHSFYKLQKTVDQYVACFADKGEVRLFFPKDLFQTHGETLNRLSSSNPSVQVTIAPLPQTHQELERQKMFFYQVLKTMM